MQQCPKCGSQAPPDAKQCPICFAALGQGAAPASPPSPAADSAHVPAPPPVSPASHHPAAPVGMSPLGIQVEVPREEDYMPAVGIPGVDNIPKDAPPVYGSPLPQPPPAYGHPAPLSPPPVGLQGSAPRTTLAGDVIEGPPQNPYGTPIGGPPMGPQSMRAGAHPAPVPAPRSRSTTVRGRSASAESRKSGGVPIVAVILTILVLGGAGAGGFWWYNNRSDPKEQTVKVLEAIKKLDFKALYHLTALSDQMKKEAPSAEAFEQQSKKGMEAYPPEMRRLAETALGSISDIQAGEPAISGNAAVVPTSVTASFMGQSVKFTGKANMIKEGGIWKLDLTNANSEQAVAAAFQGALGQPDLGSMGGGTPAIPGLGGR